MPVQYDDLGGNDFGVSYDVDDNDAYKFWQVEVSHYGPKTHANPGAGHAPLTTLSNISQEQAAPNTQEYLSYLRLGTSNVEDPSADLGYDLAQLVQTFYDDARWTNTNGAATNQLPPVNRTSESTILHYKGGWRSHTEGNRVDTTRGDKVEVVRGNYQMVVLGRQDADSNKSRYEASGGHFSRNNDNMTPGAIYEIRYHAHPTYGPTWTTIEEMTKGNHIDRFHGDILEESYGEKFESYIGDGSGGDIGAGTRSTAEADSGTAQERLKWISASSDKKLNPVMIEKIWATSLLEEEYYGTDCVWGVKYKLEQGDGGTVETWFGKYEEDWDADGKDWKSALKNIDQYTEIVSAKNATMKKTVAGAVTDTLAVGGALATTRAVGGVINDVHTAGAAIAETKAAGATIVDTNASATRFDFQIHGFRLAPNLSAVNVDAYLGLLSLDMKAAAALIELQKAYVKVSLYSATWVVESQLEVKGILQGSIEIVGTKIVA